MSSQKVLYGIYTYPDDHTLRTYDVTNDIYMHYCYFLETTYTATLTCMSGTTLGFGLDDIRKTLGTTLGLGLDDIR